MMLAVLTSCSEEETWENADYPVTPWSVVEFSEVITDDTQPVTLTKTFLYTQGRLETYAMTQQFQAVEPVELSSHTYVSYEKGEAVAIDEYGNIWTYRLDEEGYALSCLYQEKSGAQRSYAFAYYIDEEGRHLLQRLSEVLDDGSEYASLYINYTDEQALRITQYVNGEEQEYMLSSTPEHVVANVSQLPDLFLAELYPLSNHQPAYYGKLLGDAYGQLYTVLELAGKDESGERTTYAYLTDKEGRIVGCRQTTVSEGETYTREWKYRVE